MTFHPPGAAFSRLSPSLQTSSVSSHQAFSSGRVTELGRSWRAVVLRRLNELCGLDVGWDGYRAPPVAFEVANFALRLLEVTCPDDVLAPSVVPGPDGDLQLEWHTEFVDIELHVRKPYDVHAWRRLLISQEDETVALTSNFSTVTRWLAELSEAGIAARSAAA